MNANLNMNQEGSYYPQRYRKNFFVHEIATFPVACCDANELLNDVYENFPDFDFIPVRQDGKIIGVFEKESVNRNNDLQNLVRDHIRQLDEEMLIEANAFLFELISKFQANSPYMLVLRGAKIEGIITRSDLLKLPVRVYAFSLVAELEILMKEKIQERFKEKEEWLRYLSDKNKKEITEAYENLKKDNLDPELIELTYFTDKITILRKSFKNLTQKLSKELGGIANLRNDLVHVKNYAANASNLEIFLNRLENTNKWISEFSSDIE